MELVRIEDVRHFFDVRPHLSHSFVSTINRKEAIIAYVPFIPVGKNDLAFFKCETIKNRAIKKRNGKDDGNNIFLIFLYLPLPPGDN